MFLCESERIVKNGINPYGTQKYKCKACDYQFVEKLKNKIIN
jgi:transposase-like protein